MVPRLSRVKVRRLLSYHLKAPKEVHGQRGHKIENRILVMQNTCVICAPNLQSLALYNGEDHTECPGALTFLTFKMLEEEVKKLVQASRFTSEDAGIKE